MLINDLVEIKTKFILESKPIIEKSIEELIRTKKMKEAIYSDEVMTAESASMTMN